MQKLWKTIPQKPKTQTTLTIIVKRETHPMKGRGVGFSTNRCGCFGGGVLERVSFYQLLLKQKPLTNRTTYMQNYGLTALSL